MLRITILSLSVILASCGSSDKQTAGDTTAEPSIAGSEISYSLDSLTMLGYLAYDENVQGRRPGVLVVHEWWGHNDYARKRAEMLAGLGYTALAVDMYGDGKKAEHPADAGKFAGAVMQNMDGAEARFVKAMEVLKSDSHTDPDKIAAIGYCFGGGVVLNMALRGVDLDGVASFHGMLPPLTNIDESAIKADLLVCHGAADAFIPDSTVMQYRQLAENSPSVEFEAYDGAVHAFTNPDADELNAKFQIGIGYNAAADTASWQALESFLEGIF